MGTAPPILQTRWAVIGRARLVSFYHGKYLQISAE